MFHTVLNVQCNVFALGIVGYVYQCAVKINKQIHKALKKSVRVCVRGTTQTKKKTNKKNKFSLTIAMATDVTLLVAFFIVPNFIEMKRHHSTPTPEHRGDNK